MSKTKQQPSANGAAPSTYTEPLPTPDNLAAQLWRSAAPTETAYFAALCWSIADATTGTLDRLRASDFKHPTSARIFDAAQTLRAQGTNIDIDTMRAQCKQHGDLADDRSAADWYNAADALDALALLAPNSKDADKLAAQLADKLAPPQRFEILTADEVQSQPSPVALVRDILFENSVAELAGGAASYKSFQALAIAEAVAGGHDWHGHPTKKTAVVYITGEGKGGLKARLKALAIRHGRPCQARFILQAVQLHQPAEVRALLDAIAALPEVPGLIVIDTLARCFVGGDENSARDAGLFVAGVDRIRAATGATVFVLHHLNKMGTARGSTAFDGAFDTIIEAKRQEDVVTLRCTKQKDAPEFEPFTLARRSVELGTLDAEGRPATSLIFEPTDAPAIADPEAKADATRRAVLDVLAAAPEGLFASEWQKAVETQVGLSSSSFYNHRDKIVALGEAAKVGRKYEVTPFTPLCSNSE